MFQKYKYVLAVYQEGSFTRAAARLFISQPSLSVAIRNVEKKIGAPLFERCGASLRLTDAGKAYIEAAQRMQFSEDAFVRQMDDLNGLKTGSLVIGGSNYLTSDVIPQLVFRFRNQYPGVDITIIEANSVHLREMLSSEEVDLVIDNFECLADDYELVALAEEQVMLCVPGAERINQALEPFRILPESIYMNDEQIGTNAPLDISVFKEQPFVLLKSGNDMHQRAMRIFRSSAMEANVVFEVDQMNIAYAMTESGLGACFVTDSFFKYRKRACDTVLYKLDHAMAKRTLHIARKKGRYCTIAMQKFIEMTKERLDGLRGR